MSKSTSDTAQNASTRSLQKKSQPKPVHTAKKEQTTPEFQKLKSEQAKLTNRIANIETALEKKLIPLMEQILKGAPPQQKPGQPPAPPKLPGLPGLGGLDINRVLGVIETIGKKLLESEPAAAAQNPMEIAALKGFEDMWVQSFKDFMKTQNLMMQIGEQVVAAINKGKLKVSYTE